MEVKALCYTGRDASGQGGDKATKLLKGEK